MWPLGQSVNIFLALTEAGHLANLSDMSTKSLLEKIDRYCEAAGISPSTLGVRAVGNSRLYDRLQARVERDAVVMEKLEAYIAANPPPRSSDAA